MAQEVMFKFYAGKHLSVSEPFGQMLVTHYPYLSVMDELLKMDAWIESNPRKRKKNLPRFITGWLNRAMNQHEARLRESNVGRPLSAAQAGVQPKRQAIERALARAK